MTLKENRRAFNAASSSEASASEAYLDALEAEENNPPSTARKEAVRRAARSLDAAEAAFEEAEEALFDAMGWYDIL